MIITEAPSPNFDARPDAKAPQLLILHYTDTTSAFEALTILQDKTRKVSAHYLIDEDGGILRLVPEEMRAWHAGKSWWEGETDINALSIGIEIQNPGHTNGYRDFPEAQMQSVFALCRDIVQRHRILPYHVLAHSDIAPSRKKDPGELFPWEWLAQNGIGLWPEVSGRDQDEAGSLLSSEEDIRSLLGRYGYNAREDFNILLTAFQRHFMPEAFSAPETPGQAGLDAVGRMIALMRQKLALRRRIV